MNVEGIPANEMSIVIHQDPTPNGLRDRINTAFTQSLPGENVIDILFDHDNADGNDLYEIVVVKSKGGIPASKLILNLSVDTTAQGIISKVNNALASDYSGAKTHKIHYDHHKTNNNDLYLAWIIKTLAYTL